VNFTHKAWVKLSTLAVPGANRDSDKGAGFVEYGAILIFVSLVAVIIMDGGIGNRIAQGIMATLDGVFARTPAP
jgi:Flp pilus assembly pilin Flp